MKKKLLIFLSLLMLSISLVGCKVNLKKEQVRLVNGHYFYIIRSTDLSDFWINYVDMDTRVQYIMFDTEYQSCITVLVDSEGKPILYEGEFIFDEEEND